MGIGDYTKAALELDTVKNINNQFPRPEISAFCTYYQLMLEVSQLDENCGVVERDSVYRKRFEYIANVSSRDKTCLRANAVLSAFLDYEYKELFPDFVRIKSLTTNLETEDEEYSETKMLLVYPNPSSDIFNIMIDDENSTNGIIEVYDNVGKLVLSKSINNSLGYIEMNQFPKGIYQVVVSTQYGNTYFDRIILK